MFLVSSLFFFVWFPCGRLSWLHVSFWAHVNIVHHIISYHIKVVRAAYFIPAFNLRPLRLGEEKTKERRTNDRMKICMACPITYGGHKTADGRAHIANG